MSDRKNRNLLTAAISGCIGEAPSDEFNLFPIDPLELAAGRITDLYRNWESAGIIGCTAAEISEMGKGLRTLVLVRLHIDIPFNFWLIDGWTLITSSGEDLDLKGADLRRADLRGARLSGANLEDADLTGADLEKANLANCNLKGARLVGANLFSASLHGAELSEADLSRADLRHVDMRGAVCAKSAFRGADVWGTYMWNVDISQAFTEGVDFSRSDYLHEKAAVRAH